MESGADSEDTLARWPSDGSGADRGGQAFSCGVSIAVAWFAVIVAAPPYPWAVGGAATLAIGLFHLFVWRPPLHYRLTATSLIEMRGESVRRRLLLRKMTRAEVSFGPYVGKQLTLVFAGVGNVVTLGTDDEGAFFEAVGRWTSLRKQEPPPLKAIQMNEAARRLLYPASMR